MTTDDERREVELRLRGARYGWHSWERALYDALGVDTETAGFDMLDRLADLIEPSEHECVPGECPINVRHDNDRIDRDALLALADEMEFDGAGALDDEDWCKPLLVEYARRIREALGVVA